MNFTEMTIEQLLERRSAIAVELDAPEADLDALEAEVRGINEEIESRRQAEQRKTDLRAAVANGAGEVTNKIENVEENKMTLDEIRALPAYADAYKRYIITNDATECRAIITENAPGTVTSGPVPVPVIVDDFVRTAWERDGIMSRVRRTFIRGNLRVSFERSADPAVVHQEGTEAPAEENLLLGTVEMIPANIKKWITITDEALAMGGEEFLRYVYDEITYQIVRKAAADGIADILNAPAASTAAAVGVPTVTAAPSITAIPAAAAKLSDEAVNVVVIMNRLTEVNFLTAQAAGNFSVDPFAGLPRVYTSALPAYDTASSGAVYAIVGDLNGLQFNFPEGDGIVLKYDDLSLAEQDLVKIVGRQYAAHGVTAPGRFVKLAKDSQPPKSKA